MRPSCASKISAHSLSRPAILPSYLRDLTSRGKVRPEIDSILPFDVVGLDYLHQVARFHRLPVGWTLPRGRRPSLLLQKRLIRVGAILVLDTAYSPSAPSTS